MNKKGFSLVELLAVLIVLGIIMTIVTTTILKEVNSSKEKLNQSQIEIIKNAAIEYANKKGYFKQENKTYDVTIEELKEENLIDDTIINSLDKNKNYYVTLTVKCENICYFSSSDIKN